jgi:hypothetical protein
MSAPLPVCCLFLLASLSAPSWSQAVNRAQLEASASILLRDVAAELCVRSARPADADLSQMSPTSRHRLNDAELVFKSLGYGQATINGTDPRLQSLPPGPECRAHVISELWQHFTASGRPKATSEEGAAALETVALPAIAELPRLPTSTEEQRQSSTPSRPRRQASQQLPSLSVAPNLGSEASGPLDAVTPAPAPVAAESGAPSGPFAAEGASGGGTGSAPLPAEPSGARLPFAMRHLGWVGVVLMLLATAFGGLWLRRRKKVTSADLARRRLRPA